MPSGYSAASGGNFSKNNPLLLDLQQIFQRSLEDISESSAAAGLGDRSGCQRIRSGVDMVDLDPRKAFFKHRQNLDGINLRQSSIKVYRAAFLERLLVELVQGLERLPLRPA